jgi:hypothetical protein
MIDKSHALRPEFKKASSKKRVEYPRSNKIADNQREFNLLPEEDVQTERMSREIFAAAYKRWMERVRVLHVLQVVMRTDSYTLKRLRSSQG